jgi:hypothetical protein
MMAAIDELKWRPWNYLYDSGVPWLMAGLVASIGGGAGLISHRLPIYYQLIPDGVGICCMLLVFLGARQVNLRVIAPRGGYVQPEDQFHPRNWVQIPVALAGEAAIILLLKTVTGLDWGLVIAPGFVLCLAGIILLIGRQLKRPRMRWFALYLALLAGTLLWARVGPDMSWMWVGIGAPLAVLGAMRLRKFLKENPAV